MTWSLTRIRNNNAEFAAAADVRLPAVRFADRNGAPSAERTSIFSEGPGWAPVMVAFIVALSLVSASCMRRHVRAFIPPYTRPRPPFVAPPLPEMPEPPALDAELEPEPPEVDASFPVLPPPPAPPKRPPVVATPKPVPLPTPVEPSPSPRLGQIFTADQSREYNRTLDESLTRVRTVLAAAANRKLTADQDRLIVRIRTFMMQAEQAREQDLVTAVSLARRADLLAQDLAGRLPGIGR